MKVVIAPSASVRINGISRLHAYAIAELLAEISRAADLRQAFEGRDARLSLLTSVRNKDVKLDVFECYVGRYSLIFSIQESDDNREELVTVISIQERHFVQADESTSGDYFDPPAVVDPRLEEQTGNNATWGEPEIDAYLLEMGRVVAAQLSNGMTQFLEALESQASRFPESPILQAWKELASLNENNLVFALTTADSDEARILRRAAPYYCLIPRGQRANILRQVATAVSPSWAVRWRGEPPTPSIIDVLIDQLDLAMGPCFNAFTNFVSASGVTKWLMSSALVSREQPAVDTFAFTIFPYDASLETISQALLDAGIDSSSAFFRSPRRFSLVFHLNHELPLLGDLASAAAVIDSTLRYVAQQKGGARSFTEPPLESIRGAFREGRINLQNFENAVFAGSFAGFANLLLQAEGRSELIGWLPQQGDFEEPLDELWSTLFSMNSSAFAQRRRLPESKIAYAAPKRLGVDYWYEPFVRPPKLLAKTLSAMDLQTGRFLQDPSPGAQAFLRDALVGNDRLVVFGLSVSALGRIDVSRVDITSKPPQPDYQRDA